MSVVQGSVQCQVFPGLPKSTLSLMKDKLWKRIATPPSRPYSRKSLLAGYWLVHFRENIGDTTFAEITCPWIEKILEDYSQESAQKLWMMFIDYVQDIGVEGDMFVQVTVSQPKYFRHILSGLKLLSSSIPSLTKEQKILGEWFATIEQHKFASQSSKFLMQLLEVGRKDAASMAEQIWHMCVAKRTPEEQEYITQNIFSHYENTVKVEMVSRMTTALHVIV
jgi:hypothetical protein